MTRTGVASRRRYLVTGGTGFIGSAVVRQLLAAGHSVRVVDNDIRGRSSRLDAVSGDLELLKFDVRNADALVKATKDCSSLIHLAALNGTANFYDSAELVLDVGIRGMQAALEAAGSNGIREFILTSSSEAYHQASKIPTSEDVPLTIPDPWNPRYSYSASKLISEIMLANYCRETLRRTIIVRPHNVFGPDMGFDHVIPQFIMRAHERARKQPSGPLEFSLQGDGTQTRSFIYIDDFVDAFMLVAEEGRHRYVYHIGTEEEITIADVARLVGQEFGREIALRPGDAPKGAPERRCPDTRRIRALGFEPRISLSVGLRRTTEWYVKYAQGCPLAVGL